MQNQGGYENHGANKTGLNNTNKSEGYKNQKVVTEVTKIDLHANPTQDTTTKTSVYNKSKVWAKKIRARKESTAQTLVGLILVAGGGQKIIRYWRVL